MSTVPPPYGPPPPPPPEEPPGYQPFDSYYRPQQVPQQPQRRTGRNGLLGGLVAALLTILAYGKYAILLIPKLGAFGTLITMVVSFGAYAIFFGPWFAAGLVIMILVHEMGHVVEIRRQGMAATAPLFIPFLGAAVFMRQNSRNALQQAQVAIAGPLAGTAGATAAFVLYGQTHWLPLLVWAHLGFFINLFNLIPLGMLDGGWIMAVVSKWFQLIGLAALLLSLLFLPVSPIILIVILLGLPVLFARFRGDDAEYYRSVPPQARLAMGGAWLFLVAFLAFATFQSQELLTRLVG
jgi:Zn-dependent protease